MLDGDDGEQLPRRGVADGVANVVASRVGERPAKRPTRPCRMAVHRIRRRGGAPDLSYSPGLPRHHAFDLRRPFDRDVENGRLGLRDEVEKPLGAAALQFLDEHAAVVEADHAQLA